MKRLLFRMSKGFFLPLLFVLMLVFFCYFSITFSRNSERSKTRWDEYRVEKYLLSDDSIQQQIEELEVELSFLNSIFEDVSGYFYSKDDYFNEISTVKKSIRVLEYLKEKQIPYDEVIEGSYIFGGEKSRIAYSDYMVGYLFYFNIILGAFLVYQVIVAPKLNGSIILDVILYGRKRMFISQIEAIMVVTGAFCVLEYLLVLLFRTQFTGTGKYLLFATNNAIILKTEFAGFSLSMVFVMITFACTVMIEFALSQIINNTFLFYLLCAGLTFLYVDLANLLPQGSSFDDILICGFGYRFILRNEIFNVILGNLIKALAVVVFVVLSFLHARKKNYRQIYL